jgi:hypothetical protein
MSAPDRAPWMRPELAYLLVEHNRRDFQSESQTETCPNGQRGRSGHNPWSTGWPILGLSPDRERVSDFLE